MLSCLVYKSHGVECLPFDTEKWIMNKIWKVSINFQQKREWKTLITSCWKQINQNVEQNSFNETKEIHQRKSCQQHLKFTRINEEQDMHVSHECRVLPCQHVGHVLQPTSKEGLEGDFLRCNIQSFFPQDITYRNVENLLPKYVPGAESHNPNCELTVRSHNRSILLAVGRTQKTYKPIENSQWLELIRARAKERFH